MTTKRLTEDIEEVKKSLNFMSEELSKVVKQQAVYVNEHLTKRNAEIARQARLLKKERHIQDTWTRNCKVFIRLNGTPEQAKVIVVRDIADLERFKQKK